MNLEPFATSETIDAIYQHYKEKRKNEHRPHLGGSQIGNECSRALWYQFRHAWSPNFEGRMLRLFETGDREEDRVVSNLRGLSALRSGRKTQRLGCRLGSRLAVVTLPLSLDGVGEGFKESKKPHTLRV
jgi:hypothetical protein